MDETSKSSLRMLSAWTAIAYVGLIVVGWILIAGFFPLHEPSASASDIAAIFQADHQRIRIGMILVMFAALAAIPFTAVVCHFLIKVEGGVSVLTIMAVLGGAGLMVLTFYPAIWWLVAAFRPDRAPDLVYLMNDMSWLQFIGGVTMYEALPISMMIAAFLDKRPNPPFPRWFGWYNLWILVAIFPDMLLFFFQKGPFAWNGLFGFWIPLAGFGSSFFVTFFVLRKAVLEERSGREPIGA